MSQVMDLLKQATDYGNEKNYDQAIASAEQALGVKRTADEDFLANYILFMTYLEKYPASMEEEDISRWSYLPVELIDKIDSYSKKVELRYNNLSEDKKREFAEFNKNFSELNKNFHIGISGAKAREKIAKMLPKGCFIATEVYGSPQSPEVAILREFRDEVLLKSRLGQWAVNRYYSFSPSIADFLKHRMILKSLVKTIFIKPVVGTFRLYKMLCRRFERR